MIWISDIDRATSMDMLRTSESIRGRNLPSLETLDTKIASSLKKLLAARKKVFIEEQKEQNENRFLRGRQIAFMIYDNFRITDTSDFLNFSDFWELHLRETTSKDSIRSGTKFFYL